MQHSFLQQLMRQAIVAAIYAVFTWALPALAYGPIQFRLSEVMTLLAFYNPQYIVGLTVGCALSNLFSSLGPIDVIVGTSATFLALTAMRYTKNIWIASLMPTLFCVFIGLEIMYLSDSEINFFVVTGQIMLSEFVIVTIIGVPLFKKLSQHDAFRRYVLLCDKQTS